MDFKNFKKKEKPLSDNEKKSKTHVLEAMRDMAASQMGEKLKGIKKVTVASNDTSGLKAGLEKAEELIDKKPAEELSEELPEPEMDSIEAPSDFSELSEDELDEKLAELMALKSKMDARKG